MNFLSKLIIVVIISIIIAVTFLSVKIFDLTKDYEITQNKVEKINTALSLISNKTQTEQLKIVDEPSVIEETECFGIDVSHWNGDVVSEILPNSDISFIICKATQGVKLIDSEFKRNWQAIKQKDKIRGAYHFYIYNDDPIVQANHFCDVVNDLEKTDISLILDVEQLSLPKTGVNKTKLKADVIKFLEHVEKRIQRIPILYTDYAFANQHLTDSKFSKYPLWLAEYTNAKPKIPTAWKKTGYMILQRSDNYNINSTKEDFDVFQGKKEALFNNN